MMVVIVDITLFSGTPDPNAVFLKVTNHLADEDVSGVRCCSGEERGEGANVKTKANSINISGIDVVMSIRDKDVMLWADGRVSSPDFVPIIALSYH